MCCVFHITKHGVMSVGDCRKLTCVLCISARPVGEC